MAKYLQRKGNVLLLEGNEAIVKNKFCEVGIIIKNKIKSKALG